MKTLQEDLAELIDTHSGYVKKLRRFEQRLSDDRTTPLRKRYQVFRDNPLYVWELHPLDWIFDQDEIDKIEYWEENHAPNWELLV